MNIIITVCLGNNNQHLVKIIMYSFQMTTTGLKSYKDNKQTDFLQIHVHPAAQTTEVPTLKDTDRLMSIGKCACKHAWVMEGVECSGRK